jgi:hypothetical protein
MLINEPKIYRVDEITGLLCAVMGGSVTPRELQPGVYEIDHFSGGRSLDNYEEYPELSVRPYGVCDNLEQLLEACPELEAPGREFVVTLTPIRRENQPSSGGWRWHKWGKYIGTQDPQCEYLYDENDIDEVFVFHIYEKQG